MRKENWQEELDKILREKRETDFSWGKNDCGFFMGDVVHAITGVDIISWFRGTYHSKFGAIASMRRYSGGKMKASMEKIASDYGLEKIDPDFARDGDVAMFRSVEPHFQYALGIHLGSNIVMADRTSGACYLPRSRAIWSFRV